MNGGLLHPKTLPRAFAERHHVLAQVGCVGLEPAFGIEGFGVGEMGGAGVHHDGGHADGCL